MKKQVFWTFSLVQVIIVITIPLLLAKKHIFVLI